MSSKKRLIFLSSIATSKQVKFCAELQTFFDAQFWFYEYPDRTRGSWWRVDLGSNCKVLDRVIFAKPGILVGRYVAPGLAALLEETNPDIVMLGGFSIPGNYLAYRWAKRRGRATIVFTERSRDSKGVLRKRGLAWRILKWLYRDLDLVMVSAEDAVEQFRDEFCFGDKVVAGRYAADLDAYFDHPLRKAKESYTYLFANRLTEIYNPIGAIDIFGEVLKRYPGSRLVMNAAGELSEQSRAYVAELGIENDVEFLDHLKSWDELSQVYAGCDILLLPATFSNGNFTILEAMASGMGIIVSDRVLGIGKLIVDGHNGFNCEPTNEAFLDRIERYIKQPELMNNHALTNRPIAEPLGAKGTAKFFSDLVSSMATFR